LEQLKFSQRGKLKMLDNIIGTTEASKILGLSPDHVKLLCRQGKIKAKRIGKTWVIDKTSLADFKSSE
jgi:excisionase family DNA binding protein